MKHCTIFILFLSLLVACQKQEKPLASAEVKVYNEKVTSSDEVEISYTRYGNQPHAVVFVHGWSCDQGYWSEQIGSLKKDHQVVTIDLGGHGASSQGTRTDWTMPTYADDVIAVLDELEYEKLSLVGHSMGSMVVLETGAKLKNDKFSIVCVDYLKRPLVALPQEVALGSMAPFHQDFKATMAGFVSPMFLENADLELKDRIIEDMSSAPPEVAISACTNLLTRDYSSTIETIKKKNVKLSIINSDQSPVNEDHYRDLGFSMNTVKGTGHFIMLEKPVAFNSLLLTLL